MKDQVAWITDALSSKNIAREMTHYRVQGGEIRATDGRLTAGHPFPDVGEFLVPGSEFEKLLKRMPGEPTIQVEDGNIRMSSGRLRGLIRTLPLEQWDYPGIDEDAWQEAPEGLVTVLRRLRPFVSDNATKAWTLGVALEHGYAYATNNIAVVGSRIDSIGDIRAILPVWAVEFIIDREDGLKEWAWTANYVAFRWANGAWMRAQLIDDVFFEGASKMVRSMENYVPKVEVTDEFRKAFGRCVDLADGAISVSAKDIGGAFGEAQFAEDFDEELELPDRTWWAAKYLKSVIAEATHWEPQSWPKPAAFRGDNLFGVILGRSRD